MIDLIVLLAVVLPKPIWRGMMQGHTKGPSGSRLAAGEIEISE
jgi:hypothetical protein